jgi:hypothetical protein
VTTPRRESLRGTALERFTRKAALQMAIARRVSRKRKNLLDRLLTRLIDRVTRPAPADDFMRDDVVDAAIGFDVDELRRYRSGATRRPDPTS